MSGIKVTHGQGGFHVRYLKQLGTSYYVWPGASHNRFEHSLGVYHLSSLMVNRLRKAQPDLKITDRDVKCVEVAGLCHDLGHGPFSHVWDNNFIPAALPGKMWKHENASEMMLGFLVRDNNIDLKSDEIAFVKDLISGWRNHSLAYDRNEKGFLFEIVANKRNGIDVDKFDYIARDSKAVSSGTTTDLLRLVNSARVIDGEICYSEKNATTVYGLFQERFKLHKTIYQHKTAKSIEYMIVDALIKADPHLKIAERIFDERKYMYLTDDILNEVERSEGPALEEARKIIHRIRTRDLYRLIDKAYIPWEQRELWCQRFSPEHIVQAAKSLSSLELREEVQQSVVELNKDHVLVDMAEIHHGMGDKFPLDNCKFYGKYNPNKAFPPRKEADISHLLPSQFGEVLIRVYTRDSRYFGVIQSATRALSPHASFEPSPAPAVIPPSLTPEVPSTPRATPSMSDVFSDAVSSLKAAAALQTPRPSASLTSIASTPFQNDCMTVPVGFTPMRNTRARTRQQAEAEGRTGAEGAVDPDPAVAGSPKKKRKKSA